MANLIIAQLLFLEAEDPERDISLYINSPGGVVTAGLAIYDTMQYLRAPVSHDLHRHGRVAWRAVLLAAGAKGKRYALPNARIMIHQGSGGFRGNTPDIFIQVKELESLNQLNHEILARHTGQTVEKITRTPKGTTSCRPRRPRSTASSMRSTRRRSVPDQRGIKTWRPAGEGRPAARARARRRKPASAAMAGHRQGRRAKVRPSQRAERGMPLQ